MMNTLEVRKLRVLEIPDLVELHKRVVLQTNSKQYDADVITEWSNEITIGSVKNQLQSKTTSCYTLIKDHKMIGFCQFSIDQNYIYQLNIDPEFQGLGYGKYLYKFVEKKFIKSGSNSIELNSTLNAKLFYKSLGFKSIRPIKYKLINSVMDMVKMRKIL